jgi:hypothetical protein
MSETLDNYVGKYGYTSDKTFSEICEMLGSVGEVVEDKIIPSKKPYHFSELTVTQYKVKSKLYELWYQTHTPFSPEGMACAFGFESLERTDIQS